MPSTRTPHERPISPGFDVSDDPRERPDDARAREQETIRNRVRTQCFDILCEASQKSESAMTFTDVKEYMKGITEEALESGDQRTHTQKLRALEELRDHARNFAREATDLGERLLREVKNAKGDDLSQKSLARWLKRLKSRPHKEEWPDVRRQIQEFLATKLPRLRGEWRQLASDLKEVKTLAKAFNVTATEIPLLGELESKAFKSAKFPARRRKVSRALAILRGSRERKGTFYAEARTFLDDLVSEGALAKTKVGDWIQRVFAGKSPQEARKFFQTTLRPYAQHWRQARERYDRLHGLMRNDGVPRGMRAVTPEAFLEKSYDQRIAYLDLLEERLDRQKIVTTLHADVWHAFDASDWYDAGRLIELFAKDHPDHPDLPAMQRYLETHRDDRPKETKEETETIPDDEIVGEANQMLKRYPEMRVLLGESMCKDSENPQDQNARTRLVGRMMFNTTWAEVHGYTDEEEQIQDIKDERNKEQTEEYIEEGHSTDVEKNMVWGSTADALAIHDDPTAAQMIYMESDSDAQHAVLGRIEARGLWRNEKFGYWSDLVPIGMPFSRLHYFVEHDSKRLKWLMWQMHDRGLRFTPESSDVKSEQEVLQEEEEEAALAGTEA